MRRTLPSTAALAAFEAAARHQSFTLAADELAVTQGAVCRQIAALEGYVGVKLFRRTRRGVLLTEAGQGYSRRVRAHLDEVERDTLALMSNAGSGGVLQLGVVPSFATRWLLPRLGGFHRAHPGITLHLAVRTRPFLFEGSGLDAALHAGAAGWPGTQALALMPEPLVAVASRTLLGSRKRLTPADVASLPLLHISTRPYAWREWFASLGLAVRADMAGARMELFSMLAEAAVQGLGAALVPPFLIEPELARGELVPLLDHAYLSGRTYYLSYPEQKAHDPVLAAFAAWLATQVPGPSAAPEPA